MSHSSPHKSSTDIIPETVLSSVANTPICKGKNNNFILTAWVEQIYGKQVASELQHLVNPVEIQLLTQGYVE